jgi:hypothetical protein
MTDASFNNINASGYLDVGSTLDVVGGTTLAALTTSGTITANGTILAKGYLVAQGTGFISQAASNQFNAGATFDAGSTTKFNGACEIGTGGLTVGGPFISTSQDDNSFTGPFYAGSGFILSGDASFNRGLTLVGDASFNNNLSVGGDVSFNRNVYLGGDISFNPTAFPDDSIPASAIIGDVGGGSSNDVSGNLSITGDLSLNEVLIVGSDASFNGNVYIFKKLVVNEDVSLNANLHVGNSLFVGGNNIGTQITALDTSTTNKFDIVDDSLNSLDISMNSLETRIATLESGDISGGDISGGDISGGTTTPSEFAFSDFPSGIVTYTVAHSLGATKTISTGDAILQGDYSWSTTATAEGGDNSNLVRQLNGSTSTSDSFSINGPYSVNAISYVNSSGSTVAISPGTDSQHWVKLTAPSLMTIGKVRFGSHTGTDLNKVAKNVYIVGTDANGDNRLLASKLQGDLTYGTIYYVDLESTPVTDVYFVYQSRSGFNATDFYALQYQDVVLQETTASIGFVSNTFSVFTDSVSIGATDSQGYALYVSGNLFTTGTATSSDNRLKHNEINIENALETIRKLQPKHYYKTTELYDENHHFSFDTSGNMVDICGNILPVPPEEEGFIAQEVENIPELRFLVSQGTETTPYALNYNSMFTRSVKALQELDVELQAEKIKNALLESRLSDIITRLDNLENA